MLLVLPGSSRFLLTRQHLSDVTGVRSCHSKGATRIPAARNCREIVSQRGWSATLHMHARAARVVPY